MIKKLLVFMIALILVLSMSTVFAANELKDSMDKSGRTIKNVVNGAGEVVKDGATAITDGAKDLGNTIGTGARDVGSAVSGGINNISGDLTRTDNMGDNDRYTAVRTANDGTIMGMSANTWTWFVLAIAALAIVALVWYYAMQNKNEYDNHND